MITCNYIKNVLKTPLTGFNKTPNAVQFFFIDYGNIFPDNEIMNLSNKFFSKFLNNNNINKEEETMSNKPPFFSEGSAEKVTTVIADDLEIRGTMKFKSSLMIKGIFEGEVISEGLLIV